MSPSISMLYLLIIIAFFRHFFFFFFFATFVSIACHHRRLRLYRFEWFGCDFSFHVDTMKLNHCTENLRLSGKICVSNSNIVLSFCALFYKIFDSSAPFCLHLGIVFHLHFKFFSSSSSKFYLTHNILYICG